MAGTNEYRGLIVGLEGITGKKAVDTDTAGNKKQVAASLNGTVESDNGNSDPEDTKASNEKL